MVVWSCPQATWVSGREAAQKHRILPTFWVSLPASQTSRRGLIAKWRRRLLLPRSQCRQILCLSPLDRGPDCVVCCTALRKRENARRRTDVLALSGFYCWKHKRAVTPIAVPAREEGCSLAAPPVGISRCRFNWAHNEFRCDKYRLTC